MPTNYNEQETQLRKSFQRLAGHAAAMSSYTALHMAAVGEGELSTKSRN
ncbi:MAG: hypothetical protein R3C14_47855 [Caldilineaceae bacterium]